MRSKTQSRLLWFAVSVFVAIAPLVSARPALAGPLAETITTEYSAQVGYEYAAGECLVRRVFINATTGLGGQLFVNLQDFNPCTGEEFPDARMVFVPLDRKAFRIQADLRVAVLDTSVMACYNEEFECLPVDILLKWRASGPATISEEPGQFCGEDFSGTAFIATRPATVHGSVRIAGRETLGSDYFAQLIARKTVCP